MQILYYSPHPMINLQDHAGSTIRTRAIMEAFKQLGHNVNALIMGDETYEQGGGTISKQQASSFRKLKSLIPTYAWESVKDRALLRYDAKAKLKLEQLIKQTKPSLIYEISHYLQTSGIELASQYGIPHISEMNSSFPDERIILAGKSIYTSKIWPKSYRIEQQQLSQTNLIVCVSRKIQETFQNRYHIADEKFIISPNGIHTEQLGVDETLKASLIQQHGLKNQIVLGFVGSMFPYHGVDLLIKGVKMVMDTRPGIPLKLLIVGGGMILKELKELASEKGLSEVIIFTDSVPHHQVFSYLDLMDITALARTEAYMSPIKLFEYGAMKKAIIAPDQPGVREVMKHQEDGILIPSSAQAVAEAIYFYLDHPALQAQYAKAFHQKVMHQYTWKNTAQHILDSLSTRTPRLSPSGS